MAYLGLVVSVFNTLRDPEGSSIRPRSYWSQEPSGLLFSKSGATIATLLSTLRTHGFISVRSLPIPPVFLHRTLQPPLDYLQPLRRP